MSVLEIVGGVVIIVMSIAISLFVLFQEGTKGGGLTALSGGESDSFFSKNPGRTRDLMLYRATRFCAVVFFIITIAVHVAIRVVGW